MILTLFYVTHTSILSSDLISESNDSDIFRTEYSATNDIIGNIY